jgi:hypothetical protein
MKTVTMKNGRTFGMTLATGVIAMVLLLGPGAAQAAMLRLDPDDDTIAIGIDNLDVDGTFYNVTFPFGTANDLYGDPVADFDFTTEATASAAVDAVRAELNGNSAVTRVKDPDLGDTNNFFLVGFEEVIDQFEDERTHSIQSFYETDTWINDGFLNEPSGQGGDETYAVFTVVPEPCTALLLSLGGLGLFRRKKNS